MTDITIRNLARDESNPHVIVMFDAILDGRVTLHGCKLINGWDGPAIVTPSVPGTYRPVVNLPHQVNAEIFRAVREQWRSGEQSEDTTRRVHGPARTRR